MTKRIVFEVPDDVAARMRHQSAYLDVFGWVRWRTDDYPVVEGSTRWRAMEIGAD
ncbi:hypothetical protein J2X63_003213 [Agromyces sp. 3263]|uniref:hypothetical protein n=1 Tax=Agromyces sp. 3263 TaxID=2817750 RepID=UPI0028597AA1|nr:hypothetical protein [Agromyces sp. 3263]MDR6907505.1 hypothetical protein [Agromyces sp. 3263]